MKLQRRRIFVFFHDLMWTALAISGAYWLRFNFEYLPEHMLPGFFAYMSIAVPIHAITFWTFGCYRGVWRFASIPDFMRLTAAVLTGMLLATLAMFLYNRLELIPRTVIALYPLLLLAGVTGVRVAYRAIVDHGLWLEFDARPRAIVVGGGRAGEMLVRDLRRHGPYNPVAILDDDPGKRGQELHGVRIRGDISTLAEQARDLRAGVVLVAIPSANGEVLDRIVSEAIEANLEVSTLPALAGFDPMGRSSQQLRPITVEDLLGRAPVTLDDQGIEDVIADRGILVTGGGGSIGSELCRQIAAHHPRHLVVFDHSEFNLYRAEAELRRAFPEVKVHAVLGSVTDAERLNVCMQRHGISMVFHAAAYKHVPLVEENPCEGVRNNVIGTRVVADSAIRNEVEKFVLISTDKVVNPTSVMGATKRAAELYCQSLGNKSGTQFITTRFGNVLGSCGSVVPLFEEQIRNGGPVTVTDPDVTRYFMTIDESAGLILQASAIGHGGEIFVMDMGKPVRIRDLAEKMIRLYGRSPQKDVQIEYIGLRPGEKMHESLFYEQEELVGTSHPKLLLANCFAVSRGWLEGEFHALEVSVQAGDTQACIECLKRIVPGFQPYSQQPAGEFRPDVDTVPLRIVR